MLDSFAQDVRYGIRQLRQSPVFTGVALLSLALGIGANTAIFQLVDAIRLQSLPVKDPHQLAYIDFRKGSARAGWWSSRSARHTSNVWEQVRSRQEAFSGMIAWSATRLNLADGGEVRYADVLFVNGDFFPVLGVNALTGRTLNAADDTPACGSGGLVISHAFWQREFGADRNVVGRKVSLDGHPFTVLGVTPASFFGVEVGNQFDVALPLCADNLIAENGKGRSTMSHAWWLSMMGRMKPGWTLERATSHLEALSPSIMQATLPITYKSELAKRYLKNKLEATPGATGVSGLRRQYERPLWLLMATTGLVLLIACANLANLLLARASIREREVAVRLALGASRGRLVRQLLAESLLLAAGGAALGIALAQVLSRSLIAFINTSDEPRFVGLTLNWTVLGFTAALALLTCLLFGLLPALRSAHIAPASAIRTGGRSVTAGRERFGLRRGLVSLQVALSMMLLAGALLFVRSLDHLLHNDSGFKPEGVMSVNIDFGRAQYAKERRFELYKELQSKLAPLPGVVSIGQIMMAPVSGSGWDNQIGPDGTTAAASGKEALFNRVAPGYFRTMGTELLAGRDFDERDTMGAPKVAIVNEEFARKYFGGANPVGRTFHLEAEAGKPEPLMQIVGLVRNTKYYELREDFQPIGFFPVAQNETPGSNAIFMIRVAGSPSQLMQAIKGVVSEVNPTMALEFRLFSAQLQESVLRERMLAALSGAFGVLAALLATLGLYGVIAYMVARRRNEIGVRVALGASRRQVVRLVLGEAVTLLAAGLTVGVLAALWAGRGVAALLYGVKPYDPMSLGAACALLAAVALAASYAPARRAASMEPTVALREE